MQSKQGRPVSRRTPRTPQLTLAKVWRALKNNKFSGAKKREA